MKVISNLFSALLLATWIVVTAVMAVQNATGVSLRFLGGQTIQIPVGVLLALAVAVGVLGGAIVPLVWQVTNSLGSKR
jgi:uncharacterized integral membrane protein